MNDKTQYEELSETEKILGIRYDDKRWCDDETYYASDNEDDDVNDNQYQD